MEINGKSYQNKGNLTTFTGRRGREGLGRQETGKRRRRKGGDRRQGRRRRRRRGEAMKKTTFHFQIRKVAKIAIHNHVVS